MNYIKFKKFIKVSMIKILDSSFPLYKYIKKLLLQINNIESIHI